MKPLKLLGIIVRIVLTLVLIFLVHRETGIWTALCFFLIFISLELFGIAVHYIMKSLKKLVGLDEERSILEQIINKEK